MKIVQASLDFFKENEDFQFQVELEDGQDLDLVGYVRIEQDDDMYLVDIIQADLIDPNTGKVVNIEVDLKEIEDILNNNIDTQLEDSNRHGRHIDFLTDLMRDV